jgi:ankyrin repeat protein
VERKSESDAQAVYEAVAKGYADRVARLLRNGWPTTQVDWRGRTLAMVAASRGDAKVLGLLVKAGCDLRAKDNAGTTALMMAANYSKDGVAVKLLLAAGCDPNVENASGQTALMMAAGAGKLASAMLLLDAGSQFERRDGAGRSALDWARKGGFVDCERCLEAFAFRSELDSTTVEAAARESRRM